jgi:hypothetical protein
MLRDREKIYCLLTLAFCRYRQRVNWTFLLTECGKLCSCVFSLLGVSVAWQLFLMILVAASPKNGDTPVIGPNIAMLQHNPELC